MKENISTLMRICTEIAPIRNQEKWDNSGAQILFENEVVTNILLATDFSHIVLKEAIRKKANLIIVHHPPFFKPIYNLRQSNPQNNLIIQAIQNKISIIAMHTNYDACPNAMNKHVLNLIGISKTEPLTYTPSNLTKLFVYVPTDSTEKVRTALCKAGAGHIGNYSNCSFKTSGTGTFKPEKDSNPFIGKVGELENTKEDKLEIVFDTQKTKSILKALFSSHPYEEVAYDLISLQNESPGMGCMGSLEKPMTPKAFVDLLKKRLNVNDLRFSLRKDKVQKIGVITGGAGGLYNLALANHCDAYISGDIKHNEWIEANEKNLLLIDATHYGTEKYFGPTFLQLLKPYNLKSKVFCSKEELKPYFS